VYLRGSSDVETQFGSSDVVLVGPLTWRHSSDRVGLRRDFDFVFYDKKGEQSLSSMIFSI
jgi:hypothetical protein